MNVVLSAIEIRPWEYEPGHTAFKVALRLGWGCLCEQANAQEAMEFVNNSGLVVGQEYVLTPVVAEADEAEDAFAKSCGSCEHFQAAACMATGLMPSLEGHPQCELRVERS